MVLRARACACISCHVHFVLFACYLDFMLYCAICTEAKREEKNQYTRFHAKMYTLTHSLVAYLSISISILTFHKPLTHLHTYPLTTPHYSLLRKAASHFVFSDPFSLSAFLSSRNLS